MKKNITEDHTRAIEVARNMSKFGINMAEDLEVFLDKHEKELGHLHTELNIILLAYRMSQLLCLKTWNEANDL